MSFGRIEAIIYQKYGRSGYSAAPFSYAVISYAPAMKRVGMNKIN